MIILMATTGDIPKPGCSAIAVACRPICAASFVARASLYSPPPIFLKTLGKSFFIQLRTVVWERSPPRSNAISR